jgi:DNA polymerase-3 subunit epsilon
MLSPVIPQRLVFIDLETTGANAARDRITEIGIVEVDGDRVSTWSTLVNPDRPIPEFIQQLTGIRNEMVADAPCFDQIAGELAERLRGCVFIAHNARFDYGFVKNEFQRLGQRFRADVLCTVRLSRKLYPEHHRHNLDSLIERHGLTHHDRHRALADADLIWQFWRVLQRERSAELIADAVEQQLQRPNLPPQLDPELVDDMPETPGVYRFYGEHGVLLYVGKAKNLRSQVLAHFAADARKDQAMQLAREVRRINWIETVGEFGAWLLESRLVGDEQPIHNRRQRAASELCAWQLTAVAPGDFRPRLVGGDAVDFGRDEHLFGPFVTRREATHTLRKIAEVYSLCPLVLGLEATEPGRPCSALPLQQCKGACVGKETPGMHSARLMAALARLKMQAWPYPGAVGLVERDDFLEVEEVHVVDGWRYLGTAKCDADIPALLETRRSATFDMDTYKLLKAQLGKGKLQVRRL